MASVCNGHSGYEYRQVRVSTGYACVLGSKKQAVETVPVLYVVAVVGRAGAAGSGKTLWPSVRKHRF
jgi:hypothetical protein